MGVWDADVGQTRVVPSLSQVYNAFQCHLRTVILHILAHFIILKILAVFCRLFSDSGIFEAKAECWTNSLAVRLQLTQITNILHV